MSRTKKKEQRKPKTYKLSRLSLCAHLSLAPSNTSDLSLSTSLPPIHASASRCVLPGSPLSLAVWAGGGLQQRKLERASAQRARAVPWAGKQHRAEARNGTGLDAAVSRGREQWPTSVCALSNLE